MNGEINLIAPLHPILGEILHLVQGNPNPNCVGTGANGRKAHPIGGLNHMWKDLWLQTDGKIVGIK